MSDSGSRQLEHDAHQPLGQKFPLVILLDNFQLPANVGSIFRIADALGVKKLYLGGSTPTPPNRNIKKTSRSTEKYVAYEHVSDAVNLVRQLKSQDYLVISLEITESSAPINTFDFNQLKKVCLILGAENQGVSQALLDISDVHLHISMQGENSSMNVAVACGIAVYQIVTSGICSKP